MDLTQLRTLVAVSELGTLSKASGHLHIAQPALSRQIRLLEEELGLRLFDRHGRGMALTEDGREVLRHAVRVLGEVEALRASAAGDGSVWGGHVAIGLPPTVGDLVSVSLVEAFRTRFPRAMVQLVGGLSGFLLDWLCRGDIELAILYDPRPTPAIRSQPVMRESLFLIGAADSGLSPERPVPFADVVSRPLLLPSARQGLRDTLDRIAAERGFALTVTVETDSYIALKNLVRNGYGCTILPPAAIHDDLANGSLTAAPIVDPVPMRRLVLSYPSDRPASRLASFAGAVLIAIMADRVERGGWSGDILVRPNKSALDAIGTEQMHNDRDLE